MMIKKTTAGKAILALSLLVPAPSIGTLAAMQLMPGTLTGKTLFAAAKVWLFIFPLFWLKFVDKGHISISPPKKGGLPAGLLSGLLIGFIILAAYALLGRLFIDQELFLVKMQEIGLSTFSAYLGGAAYWILINSLIEEYVWRWFVYKKCEDIFNPLVAVLLSALFFTLHHFIALQVYCSIPLAIAGSAGVFTGGAIWSMLYMKYRSVWPGYLSHAVVDLFIFGIGAKMLLA